MEKCFEIWNFSNSPVSAQIFSDFGAFGFFGLDIFNLLFYREKSSDD